MSLFKIVKYSSLLFFMRKYRGRIFRIVAVLLFALITNLLYQDVANYLELRHPGALIWALIAKIAIVYGALAFVLWQFRPGAEESESEPAPAPAPNKRKDEKTAPTDRLSVLADIERRDDLRTRYDRILAQDATRKSPKNPE